MNSSKTSVKTNKKNKKVYFLPNSNKIMYTFAKRKY